MLAHGADKIGLTWPTCLLQTVVGTVLDWPSQMSVSPSNFRDDFMVNGGGVDVHIFVLKNTNDGTATAPEQICMTLVNLQVLFFLSRVSTTMLTRDIDIAVLSVRQPVCHVRVLC